MYSKIILEDLPNELLLTIFKCMDARRLYQSFYNLNSRFNQLLKILPRLCLVLWSCKDDSYDDLFLSRVHTLVVHFDVDFILSRYINIRHLVLLHSKHEHIFQMMIEGCHLERISLISPRCFYTTYGFHEMIFSNKFPRLKSCHLTAVYSPSLALRQLSWNQSPSLRSLCISSHDSLIHVPILNACPNLAFLSLSIFQLDQTPMNITPHRNLKRMEFIWNNLIWPSDEKIFKTFFLLIPCLEQLSIRRSAAFPELTNDLLQFDWLSRIIIRHLVYLKQFRFCLHLLTSTTIDRSQLNTSICQIEKNFVNIFDNYKHYHLQISQI